MNASSTTASSLLRIARQSNWLLMATLFCSLFIFLGSDGFERSLFQPTIQTEIVEGVIRQSSRRGFVLGTSLSVRNYYPSFMYAPWQAIALFACNNRIKVAWRHTRTFRWYQQLFKALPITPIPAGSEEPLPAC